MSRIYQEILKKWLVNVSQRGPFIYSPLIPLNSNVPLRIPPQLSLAQLSLGPTDRVLTSAAGEKHNFGGEEKHNFLGGREATKTDQTDGLLGPTEIQWDLMAYNRNIRNIMEYWDISRTV